MLIINKKASKYDGIKKNSADYNPKSVQSINKELAQKSKLEFDKCMKRIIEILTVCGDNINLGGESGFYVHIDDLENIYKSTIKYFDHVLKSNSIQDVF